MVKKLINSAIFAGMATAVVFPPHAFAYLDPGTGSYVLQVAAAVFFGGIFVVKTFWGHITSTIKGVFGGKGKKNSENHHNKNK
jgi:hypothetical protein